MRFDWWTFAFQLVNVAVLLWLLGRFMFRPVARIVAERRAETDRVLGEAQAARAAARGAEQAAQAERDRLAADRVELLEKARAEAEAQRRELLARAEAEAADIVGKAREEAKRALEDERAEEVRRAAKLSVAIANRLLGGMPADARIGGYPQRLADALAALDAGEKAAMLADGTGLRLVAPRALSEAELAAVRETLAPLLPPGASLPVEIDDTLIAGLELRGRHGVVRNSLAADLARMTEALDGGEEA
ncbi:MAG: H+-transporting two-sector ATPase B/B' subunit [Oricola sp.]